MGTCPQSPTVLTSMRKNTVEMLFRCNHEDADTRLVLHASRVDTNVVAVSKDTDVLLPMVHAYAKIKPNGSWFMKVDHEKCVNIKMKIGFYLGTELAMKLSHILDVTGCDTPTCME